MPQTQIVSGCWPIIQTNWHQLEPYNSSLPVDWINDGGAIYKGNVFTGCAVTAIAQLICHYEYAVKIGSTSIFVPFWEIKLKPQVTSSDPKTWRDGVAYTHKLIFEQTSTTPQKVGDYVVASGTTDVAIERFLTKYFICGSHNLVKWDSSKAKSSLDNYRPILVAGMGHSWLMDGYLVCKKMTRNIVDIYDKYWHANFGWGDSNTGYYRLDATGDCKFEISSSQFYYDWELKMIHDIQYGTGILN